MTTKLAVKRITLNDALKHLNRDGQEAYDYMVADQVSGLVSINAELLAALEGIIGWAQATGSKKPMILPSQIAAVEFAQAAIAKAKG